jgi:hypothetical protein
MTEPKRRAQKTYRQPIAYEIGKDLPQEQYEAIMVAVGDWFREWRATDEPMADARFRIKCCLEGTTIEGQPWFSAWNSTFAARMRMLCRFDIEKMQPIRTGDEKRRQRKQATREKEYAARRAGNAANDPHIPELTKGELNGAVNYGTKALPVTDAEQRTWEEYRDAYLIQFPELRTVNAKGELSMLCDLHVVHERNRLKLLKGERIDANALLDTTRMIADLKKALGIHPDQLQKRVDKDRTGSLADAVARFESMPQAVRDKFLAEELLLLWQMYQTPSPRGDGSGYQLDEVGLFGATRCATCACAKCGHVNFRGLSVEQIQGWLEKKRYLVPDEDPVPETAGGDLDTQTGPDAPAPESTGGPAAPSSEPAPGGDPAEPGHRDFSENDD